MRASQFSDAQKAFIELEMQLRNKTPKRRVKAKLQEDRQEAIEPNAVWAMDFVHDQLAKGTGVSGISCEAGLLNISQPWPW